MGLKNKRGFFFTTLVIVIFSIFFLSYSLYSSVQERKAVQQRVSTMNNFIYSIEQDLQRQVFIAGFRSIFIIEKKISSTGQPITNLSTHFQTIFYNASFEGTSQDLMEQAAYQNITDRAKATASTLNINMDISEPRYNVTQEDPWNVKFNLTVNLYAEDNAGLASWTKTENIIALVPIEYFEDPLYVINARDVPSKFKRTPYTNFASDGDITNLTNQINNRYYKASTTAPSFLDRLQGITSPNVYGVESFVPIPELPAGPEKSVVDYIYFDPNNDPQPICTVSGAPSWFYLDQEHLADYNVSSIASC